MTSSSSDLTKKGNSSSEESNSVSYDYENLGDSSNSNTHHANDRDLRHLGSTKSTESLASSISSLSITDGRAPFDPIPLPYENIDNEEGPRHERFRRRSSVQSSQLNKVRSYSTAASFGEQAIQSIRKTLSRTTSVNTYNSASSHLSRLSSSYSVRDIYGEMSEDDINLRRTVTKSTILTSLSQRVHDAGIEAQTPIISDEDEEWKATTAAMEEEIHPEGLYEKLPDIPVPSKDYGGEFSSIDPELVTWDGVDDPNYPRNWCKREKWFQTLIVALYTLISPMSSSILSPAMQDIAKEFHMNSDFIQSFSVSVMVLAWALGPLLIAPMSESDNFGRKPVLNVSIWIIFIFNLACGFAKTTAQLCVFRFLGGLGGCAALNVGAGTLSDLFTNEERQVAMAFYSVCPTMGPILSPIISSFIVQNTEWRWLFYVLAIFNGAVALFGTIFFKETYSPRLLKLKANYLRKETGNEHLHTIFEIADGETKWEKFMVSISRPLKLLFTHPMILGLGSFMAFTYGFMYLMIVTFPRVWKGNYGFSTGISGLMFLPMGIGYAIGIVFFTIVIDIIYFRLTDRNNGVSKPEYRLPCLCFSGIGIPVGLIWYGWSAEKRLHWIMPSIGSAIYAFSFIAVFQTIQNYLIDMNNRFAASSVAAAAVFRSLFGFAFPLFANQMYDKLNYGWGNTLCGLIGLLLGIPFPIFCLMYGEKLRKWANKRMDREQAKRDARNLERLKKLNEKELSKFDNKGD